MSAASSTALGIPRKKERKKKTEKGMYMPILFLKKAVLTLFNREEKLYAS